MSPILVPTLAELGIELQRARAAYARAVADEDAGRIPSSPDGASDTAAESIALLRSQIAEIPAASLADLRVKAAALSYWLEGSSLYDPRWANEETLSAQLVAGLLDERIA